MKVVLLAGGLGTRLSEYTNLVPKPMVEIGEHPILWHIMNLYAHYGHKDFYVALGYKGDVIKNFFSRYHTINSDFSVNLKTGKLTPLSHGTADWDITLIDTGLKTMTGGRIKRLRKHIGESESFLLTYGDGLADINIKELINFHKSHGRMVTMTAVRPSARFGELNIQDGKVVTFEEKPQLQQGWINGGFFVVEPSFFDLIDHDDIMLEREPLMKAASMGELMAYQHDGFWQCMDTKRERDLLENLWVIIWLPGGVKTAK